MLYYKATELAVGLGHSEGVCRKYKRNEKVWLWGGSLGDRCAQAHRPVSLILGCAAAWPHLYKHF